MTRIEYTIDGRFAGIDMVNRILRPSEIDRYIRRARREIGVGVEHEVSFIVE